MKAVDAGGGKATLTDGLGRHAHRRSDERQADHGRATSRAAWRHVTIPDVVQSNGVIHVVDKVLLPK